MPVDNAGNTLGTAKGLNINASTQISTDWVGSLDTQDFYSFSLSGRSSFKLSMNGLTADANMELLNSSGALIQRSGNTGTSVETINRTLDTGTYYIRVYPGVTGAETNYNINYSANLVPKSLQFTSNKTSYNTGETVSLTNTSVLDDNGATDLSRVDFWLQKDGGTWIDASDATSFTISTTDNRLASFNYSLSNLAAGSYQLKAAAEDKSGGRSVVTQIGFSVTTTAPAPSNAAPTSLQFSTNKTSYNVGETVSLASTSVSDANGATDLSRVDFWLQKDGGTWTDISDATSFTISTTDNRLASFNYSVSSLAAGNYQLRGVAYDKAGASSSAVISSFSMISATPTPTPTPTPTDWFSQNLRDAEIIGLARSLAADSQLNRADMISIFRNAKDGAVIDATELTDLRTIVTNASRFNMQDAVRVLSNKIANGDLANQKYQGASLGNLYAGSTDAQMEKLISKWFFGSDRPTTSYTYQAASGSLFQNGVSYQDVYQGSVGNCYFLASLATTAFRSAATIQDMFIDNGDNTFSVRFFKSDGSKDYVTVDKYLPSNGGKFIYAHQAAADWGSLTNSSNELWVALAEKAYAQLNESGWIGRNNTNSYDGLASGNSFYAIPHVSNIKTSYSATLDLNTIVTSFNAGRSVIMNSNTGPASNVVANHAYVMTSYNSATQKFTLFNPWGMGANSTKPGLIEVDYNQLKASFSNWVQTTA